MAEHEKKGMGESDVLLNLESTWEERAAIWAASVGRSAGSETTKQRLGGRRISRGGLYCSLRGAVP